MSKVEAVDGTISLTKEQWQELKLRSVKSGKSVNDYVAWLLESTKPKRPYRRRVDPEAKKTNQSSVAIQGYHYDKKLAKTRAAARARRRRQSPEAIAAARDLSMRRMAEHPILRVFYGTAVKLKRPFTTRGGRTFNEGDTLRPVGVVVINSREAIVLRDSDGRLLRLREERAVQSLEVVQRDAPDNTEGA